MHWISFGLFHLCEHRARTAYCNVTAYYYSTMVAHGLSGTHAKWPKYWLGFRAPRIPLLLNTQHFHICHNHCAAPLLSFLLEENKAKNAGLDFLRHHQINTSSPEKPLKEHLVHKINLQLMLLLKQRSISKKTLLILICEKVQGLTLSNNHTPLAQWVYQSVWWVLPHLSILNGFGPWNIFRGYKNIKYTGNL